MNFIILIISPWYFTPVSSLSLLDDFFKELTPVLIILMRWKTVFDIGHIFLYLITGIKSYEDFRKIEAISYASTLRKDFLFSIVCLSLGNFHFLTKARLFGNCASWQIFCTMIKSRNCTLWLSLCLFGLCGIHSNYFSFYHIEKWPTGYWNLVCLAPRFSSSVYSCVWTPSQTSIPSLCSMPWLR